MVRIINEKYSVKYLLVLQFYFLWQSEIYNNTFEMTIRQTTVTLFKYIRSVRCTQYVLLFTWESIPDPDRLLLGGALGLLAFSVLFFLSCWGFCLFVCLFLI